MLTKQQVFDAALKYAQEQNLCVNKAAVPVNDDFIAGARWAAEQVDAENTMLRKDNIRLFEQAAALQAENAVLRSELNAVIDRYEVANMLAGDDPVIEKAKKALEK